VACATGSAANTVVARAITPAAGREGTTFTTHTAHGHTYVVPDDARGLLASGRVDRRLFDVTTLLDHGYRDGAPLIVTGRTPVRTPVGVVREYETHTLTINYLDENGEPTPNSGSYITSYTHDYRNELSDEDGTVEIDLRAGRYLLDHQVFRTGEDEHVHAIVQPNLELTADTTITVDARTTKPLDITPPAGVSPQLADIGYTVRTPSARYVSGLVGGDPSMVSTAHLGAPPPAGDRLIARGSTPSGTVRTTRSTASPGTSTTRCSPASRRSCASASWPPSTWTSWPRAPTARPNDCATRRSRAMRAAGPS
jgi:hypothetical protein